MPSLLEKTTAFAERHRGPGMIVLPNAWDPGSAVMLARAGFPFVATTSAGISFAQGVADGERLSRSRMLELAGQIAAAVDVPVTADLEAGYGPLPEDVAETVKGAFEAGLVGCNIEDGTSDPDRPLIELPLAVERIHAGAEAARATGAPFVLNARTDPYLARVGTPQENLAEAIRRANAYREAGADCLFVPGALGPETIATLVREIQGPVNVLGARGGAAQTLSMAELEALGVRRASLGGSLMLATLALVQRAAAELLERGTVSYTRDALSNADGNALMSASRGSH